MAPPSWDSTTFDKIQSELGSLPAIRSTEEGPSQRTGVLRSYPPPKNDMKMPRKVPRERHSEPDNYFTITIQKINHPRRPIQVHVTHLQDILQVKRHVSRIFHVPASDITLLFKGKVLKNTNLVADCGLQASDVLHIKFRKPGDLDQDGTTEAMDPCFTNRLMVRRVTKRLVPPGSSSSGIAAQDKADSSQQQQQQQDSITSEAQQKTAASPQPVQQQSSLDPTSKDVSEDQSADTAQAASSTSAGTSSNTFDSTNIRPAESTRAVLKNNASQFRVDLQKLLYRSFPPDQASVVSKTMNSFFGQL
ncbi:hypothetical protein H4219_005225 [Mycoemilia scoparia]|uniref:Ubiquitin-like domain-containing protein n=1 Tax=Mycoemilia scoparia TaxID=417184 RepID=A0A9W7ZNU8_9FUNG|nr:hypothetical protein H4219_005225 [Mycoemilia scoparia]